MYFALESRSYINNAKNQTVNNTKYILNIQKFKKLFYAKKCSRTFVSWCFLYISLYISIYILIYWCVCLFFFVLSLVNFLILVLHFIQLSYFVCRYFNFLARRHYYWMIINIHFVVNIPIHTIKWTHRHQLYIAEHKYINFIKHLLNTKQAKFT